MKNITKTLLVAVLGLTLAGCNNEGNSSTTSVNSNTSVNTSTSSSTVAEDPILAEIAARIVVVKNNQEVADDFEVPSKVEFEYEGTAISVNITWTADSDTITFNTVNGVTTAVLNRPAKGEEAKLVRFTASFEYDGKQGSKNFKVTVLPSTGTENLLGERTIEKISTWSEWINGEGKMAVQGVVTAWTYDASYGNGNVFFQDAEGGYYGYRVVASQAEFEKYLAIGNEVIMEGDKTIYEGFHEFNQKTVTAIEIVNKGNGTRPEPVDVTTAAKEGQLTRYQSMWTTVLGTYSTSDEGTYIQVGGYKYEIYNNTKYNGETFDEVSETLNGLTNGDTIRMTGLVGCYKVDQFHPYSVVKSDETITVSPEEKVKIAIADASAGFKDLYAEAEEVSLYTSTDDSVTVTYALDEAADTTVFALNSETNKLTVTPTSEEKTATLTITATCGSATETTTVTLKACSKIDVISLEEATEIGKANNDYTTEKYYIKGEVKSLYGNEESANKYGNFIITNGTTDFIIYGLYSKDGSTKYENMETKVEAGDEIIVYGILGNYNGTAQMKNGWLYSLMETTAIDAANTIGVEVGENKYTEEKYYVRGEVKSLYGNEENANKYGNFVITDGTNELIIYGLYSADGATKYQDFETPVKVGDTILVYGILGNFNGTAQMKNGWLVTHNVKAAEEIPSDPVEMTIAEALEATDGTPVIVTGKVTQINEAWNPDFSNITVTIEDEEGNSLYIYRLATEVKMWDVIKVTGEMATHNGSRQIAKGATAEILEEGNYVPPAAETRTITKVTSLDQLTDGAEVVLASGTTVMGAQNGTKRDVVNLETLENSITIDEKIQVVTLVKSGDNWLLKVSETEYLAYSGSGNSVATVTTTDAASQWTVQIVEGLLVITNVSYTDRVLQYNASSPRFCCYKGTQVNLDAYILG